MIDYSELRNCMDKLVERGDKFCSFEIASLLALIDEVEALRKTAARYQHIKSTWHNGDLIDRLAANVLPEDWDAVVDADIGKGGLR